MVAAASLVNLAEVFFVRSTLHSTAGAYGLMESVWVSASAAGGWWVARRRPSDAGLARLLLGSLVLTCLGVALMATVPAVAWLAPVSLLRGAGNGGVNVAAGVLGRRVPAATAGLGGLAATAAFALPVLRAVARERDTIRQPCRMTGPDRATGHDRATRQPARAR